MLDTTGVEIASAWLPASGPPPSFTVSEWADANRYLPESSAARGARWQTSRTPYLREIMDAVLEPGVTKIALRKSAQVGGSEALHNIIGYFMQHQPCPMLLIHPTVDVAEEWSKERLTDMLASTPVLGAAIVESLSTLTYKVFPGGYLALGGGNTPNSFARRSVRIAIADDADRLPAVVGEEGDPADLLADRVTAWDDGLQIFVSTPTLKHGRIDTLYERSDQRKYHVECPACGHWDWIAWKDQTHFRVTFDHRDPETARLQCPACKADLYEPQRRQMVSAGEWRPTATPQELGLVGFHLPAMVSTLGNVTLPQIVEKFLAANAKGKESLRVFINTTLAEGWEEQGTRMQPQVLFNRREAYGQDVQIPAAAAALTAGVDVQQGRFEVQVTAWGPGAERWVVDYRVIPGDPRHTETQGALIEALQMRYAHELGVQLPILATCLDTGYATEEMYDFVLGGRVRRLYATKGVAGKAGEPIVGRSSDKRYGKSPRPVPLFPINVDDAKADLYSSLSLAGPGPGWIHFPNHLDTVDEEYFAQLCAEHRETRYNRSGVATHTVWVQDRERNEAFDTAILCLAAWRLLNVNIKQLHAALVEAAAAVKLQPARPAVAGVTPPPPHQPSPSAPARRVSRSGYLGR